MTLEWIEFLVRWLGGLLATITLGVIFYGIWRGTQRQAGRIDGQMGRTLRSPWFYLVTSAIFFGACFFGWIPLPLAVSPQIHNGALLIGSLLYFPGMGLALWGRLALGKNYFVSTGLGAQLFADQQLVTRGPFAIVRHPMYTGLILAALGSLLIYHTWTALLLACFSPAFINRARREETILAAEFGAQWQEYCQRVPKWMPRLKRRINR